MRIWKIKLQINIPVYYKRKILTQKFGKIRMKYIMKMIIIHTLMKQYLIKRNVF